MGLEKKVDALLSLEPDVAVVPECSEKSAIALRQRGYGTLWYGSNPQKGLGVVCRKEWGIRALQEPEHKWIVPIAINAPTPFTLLAVWACAVGTRKAENYIGQLYGAITANPGWFKKRPVVVAGDLNSNKIWDGGRPIGNHSDVVKFLADAGLASGYHEFFGEQQGAESRGTIYFYRHANKPYHIDYVFIPRKWCTGLRVEVGEYVRWSKLSDHCPVTVDVLPCAAPANNQK